MIYSIYLSIDYEYYHYIIKFINFYIYTNFFSNSHIYWYFD